MTVVILKVGESITVRGVRVRVVAVVGPEEVRLEIDTPPGTQVWRGDVNRFNPDEEPPEKPGAA
jgi:hypothetical protein